MSKSKESFNKKDRENKKRKQQELKREKKELRKSSGSSENLSSMMAYLDENGNLTSTPPDPSLRKTFNLEDIQIGVPQASERDEPEELIKEGVVSFFNLSKGFGFIIENKSGERIFMHVNQMQDRVAENDKVFFETERGHKGLSAVNVRKKK